MSHAMSQRPLVSIVCPAYEEEAVLPAFHSALNEALECLQNQFRFEILYIDDGSRDRTFETLRDIAEFDARVRVYSLSRNFGHQAALTAGLDHAAGEAIVTLDSDLQHPPSLIPQMIEAWRRGYDVVQSIRADEPTTGWWKQKASAVFYRAMRRWTDLDVRPAGADFRLLSRRALDGLRSMRESHRYLRGMVQWMGFRVAEAPFRPDPRRAGASKYTWSKMVRLAMDGMCSFSRAPLRLSVAAGITATTLSLLASFVLTLARARDWPLAAVVTAGHLVVLALFATVGVLGEYVGRVYEECKHRPPYLIQDAFPLSALESTPVGGPTHSSFRSAA